MERCHSDIFSLLLIALTSELLALGRKGWVAIHRNPPLPRSGPEALPPDSFGRSLPTTPDPGMVAGHPATTTRLSPQRLRPPRCVCTLIGWRVGRRGMEFAVDHRWRAIFLSRRRGGRFRREAFASAASSPACGHAARRSSGHTRASRIELPQTPAANLTGCLNFMYPRFRNRETDRRDHLPAFSAVQHPRKNVCGIFCRV